jgi:signal transduction histidine kinase
MRLPALTFTFVIVSLVVLAVAPFVMVRRLDQMRRVTEATSGTALRDVSEIHDLLMQQVIEHQSLRLRADTAAARRYFALRAEEDARLARLDSVTDRMSPAIDQRVTAFRRMTERWHVMLDARAAGRMSEARFDPLVGAVRAQRDSVLAAHAELKSMLEQAELHDAARGERLVDGQQWISIGVGALALLSALAVAWFARREHALSEELARTLDEEARLRAESERRRDDLERVTESKGRLIRGFTHDVKNPLGAADGFLQLLQDGIMDPLTERQQHSVARARRLLASALSLIGDLLELNMAETGHLELHRGPVDLCETVRDLVEEYRPQAERKGLRVATDLPAHAPLAYSDPVRVRQVLGNLVSNAVKYTERGVVTLRIRQGADGGSDRVAVEVADTGSGIAPEKQRLLFQEFVRLDPAAGPGAGVGLAISHRIVQALDGDIAVDSVAGRGSTFTLSLPTEPPGELGA